MRNLKIAVILILLLCLCGCGSLSLFSPTHVHKHPGSSYKDVYQDLKKDKSCPKEAKEYLLKKMSDKKF